MSIFGVIMVLAVIQLFGVGSVIQRGNHTLIPDFLIRDIQNRPAYCCAFGNRLILLSLIAALCAVMSFMSRGFSCRPILFFGLGIALVLLLLFWDYRRFKQ